MKEVKAFFQSKSVRMSMMVCSVATFMCCSAFAVGEVTPPGGIDAAAITTAFTTGFTSIVTNSVAMLSAMLPIAIGLCGVLFVVKKGMTWFKSVAK